MSFNVVIGKPISNPFVKDGKALVSKIEAREDPKRGIVKAVDAIGGFGSIANEGDKVLVKPNYNSASTPPASTEPEFVLEFLNLEKDGRTIANPRKAKEQELKDRLE